MSVEVVPMAVESTAIGGLTVITSKAVTDERGTVREFFRSSAFEALDVGVPPNWAQVNLTYTEQGALRGLHGEATDKLTRSSFNEFVLKKTKDLQQQKNCHNVEYVVEVLEGHVKLKALVKS